MCINGADLLPALKGEAFSCSSKKFLPLFLNVFLRCCAVSFISVKSVSYDFDRYELVVDIETASVQPPSDSKVWVIEVVGYSSQYAGSVLAEYPFTPGTRFTARVGAHPLYLYAGAAVNLIEYTIDPEGRRWPGVIQSINIDTKNLDGIKKYWSWRDGCLSKAVWKAVAAPAGGGAGGFVAVYSVVVDSSERAAYIDITVDGTTRYFDIYSCWFGVGGGLFAYVGQTKLSRVRVDLSRYWREFLDSGLLVQPRDYSGYLVDGFTIRPSDVWLPSRVSPSTNKSIYAPGEQMEAAALLEYLDLDGSWKPLPNKTINMCIDTSCAQVPTDPSGRARWVTRAPEKPGTYTLKAEFQGG